MRASDPARAKQLAAIHILAAQDGLDDATYRDMLWTVARVRSAAALDLAGRMRVLDHLTGRRRGRRPTPAADVAAMAGKVRALLADAGRPDVYADRMAQRMFRVQFWEWCQAAQMHKLIAALQIDANRRRGTDG